ncbi:MAG: hypothetical protein OIN90_14190 [Candidatus Methanoperedens sp.]|nr:hypothetical protein [Candidatus Methanoperedens sp.]
MARFVIILSPGYSVPVSEDGYAALLSDGDLKAVDDSAMRQE